MKTVIVALLCVYATSASDNVTMTPASPRCTHISGPSYAVYLCNGTAQVPRPSRPEGPRGIGTSCCGCGNDGVKDPRAEPSSVVTASPINTSQTSYNPVSWLLDILWNTAERTWSFIVEIIIRTISICLSRVLDGLVLVGISYIVAKFVHGSKKDSPPMAASSEFAGRGFSLVD